MPAARWLTSRDVVAIGCDNMAVEVLPNPDRGLMMPVHQHVLAEAGVYLIENLALDELARERLTSVLLHPAGDQVQGRDRLPGASGRAAVETRLQDLDPMGRSP